MKKIIIAQKAFFVLGLLLSLNLYAQFPYQNPNLSSEQRAKDLISRLTLKEKAALMCDESEAIPRLGIKKFNWWSEALHGVTFSHNVTVFPEPIGMAASFDDSTVFYVFNAVSDEFRALYNNEQKKGLGNRRFLSLSVWTPNVNIFRDPRWGRGQETYGEDPYLTSRMGISVVKGLQGPENFRYKKLLACAKHFAVHSGPEWERHKFNITDLDPRDLWETYLPAFKALVEDAGVREVMCAYQRIDNAPCCGSTRLLQKILRDDWGFKYLVVSDCGAIADFYNSHKVSPDALHAAVKGVLAGTDVECGFGYAYDELPEAVKSGLVSEGEIDKHLERVLIGRFDLGEMDNDSLVPWSKIPITVVNSNEHKKLALKIAQESMTLLQNKNNILPLNKNENIAVIGPNADNEVMMWGNYCGFPDKTITILDGIKSKIPANKIFYDQGCDITEDMITKSYIGDCSFEGKKGIAATYWNNRQLKGDIVATVQIVNPIQLTTAGQHQFAEGVKLQEFSARYQTVYNAKQSEEIMFNVKYGNKCLLIVNADTLLKGDAGTVVSAKIPYKVEKGNDYRIEVDFIQQYNWIDASLSFNFGKEIPINYNELVKKLKGIDTVVFVGGISPQLENEEMPVLLPGFKGGDRTDIELPASQRKCLQALKKAGKKIIFVDCSGSAIGLVPETESCDAILQAWYSGEQGGLAVADVLFGDYNPSGKLPITFYKNINQLPNYEDYSMKGRTYRYMSDPLFPFGFGLSYTNFSIGDAHLSKSVIHPDESVELNVPVKNKGKLDGSEVVQVYIHKVNDSDGPIKTLRGFQRVFVQKGKTINAIINLGPGSFEFYDRSKSKMVTDAGEYEVMYGTSSDANDLKTLKILVQ